MRLDVCPSQDSIRWKNKTRKQPRGKSLFGGFSFNDSFLLHQHLRLSATSTTLLKRSWAGEEGDRGDRQQERVTVCVCVCVYVCVHVCVEGAKLHKYYIKQSEHHGKKICINNLYSLAPIYLAHFLSALSSTTGSKCLYVRHVCLFGLKWSKEKIRAVLHVTACVVGCV